MTPRAQVKKICLALPEATEERSGRHAAFLVRNKKFAYYLDDHHGDGRLAVTTRAAPGQNTALVASDPGRFFIPSYIGSRGWVGLYLDVGPFDWTRSTTWLSTATCWSRRNGWPLSSTRDRADRQLSVTAAPTLRVPGVVTFA